MSDPLSDQPRQTSAAFAGAYQKGRVAARKGKPRRAPYVDKRGAYHNMITFSQSFINFWHEGWDDEKAKKPERYTVKPRGKASTPRLAPAHSPYAHDKKLHR